ncbi:MAG: hypothetical protein KME31_26825 [Tolypothrix carrinoi HA7290-LM1]|nr:hypothetical protein [Tolypothrix carrinoi HA7290-LM1]
MGSGEWGVGRGRGGEGGMGGGGEGERGDDLGSIIQKFSLSPCHLVPLVTLSPLSPLSPYSLLPTPHSLFFTDSTNFQRRLTVIE